MQYKYDFTTVVDRSTLGSSKWELMKEMNPDVKPGIVPLSVADMEFVTQPEIVAGLKNTLEHTILGYTSPTESYFNAIISWMDRRHQWKIKKEWIIVTPGVVPALRALIKVLANPGEGIIILSPVYYPFYTAIESNGNKIVTSSLIDVNRYYEIDFKDLEDKLSQSKNTMMILCSPHNPIGRVWKQEELIRIADLCLKYNVILIADEIHHDIVMSGNKHTAVASLSDEYQNHIITCTSVSKTFNLAGMRISNIIIKNEEYRKKLNDYFSDLAIVKVNALSYQAVEIGYNDCEEWLGEVISVIEDNRDFVVTYLAEHLPEVKVYPLEATYLLWTDFRGLFDDCHELEKFMVNEAQVFLDEGYIFGFEGNGFERFNLACPKHILKESLERIVKAYKK